MRTGISTASLFMRQYNEDAVQTINRLGVKTCEIFLETFSEYTRAYGELLNERKGNLSVNSVHLFTTNLEPQLFSENERTRKDAFYFLGEAMNAANAFGSEVLYVSRHGALQKKFEKRLERQFSPKSARRWKKRGSFAKNTAWRSRSKRWSGLRIIVRACLKNC